ncbi:hypothetical protein Gogos_018896 [Gossypium gossypioides]|uniref:RNase H type-1 domain-containing protein n=1 Tax=Gossypium gossypioides TaxID=34282 RepID=A0A7J9BFR8_GOSGO|nr:hypothetical protein [Gossypium gossypioides]
MECDNALLVESVLTGSAVSSNLVELYLINGYLRRNWKTRIRHIHRSQNMTVDQMTKCTYDNQFGLKFFEDSQFRFKRFYNPMVISSIELFDLIARQASGDGQNFLDQGFNSTILSQSPLNRVSVRVSYSPVSRGGTGSESFKNEYPDYSICFVPFARKINTSGSKTGYNSRRL